MKKEDLKELVLRSLTEEISENDRKILESEAITEYGFSSSFRNRVMGVIISGPAVSIKRLDLFSKNNTMFVRIALSGLAAILILAISLFVSQGSLSYDTLLGLDNSVDEGLISLLID